ncbi:hypothetical protein HAN_3g521 (nucleomorph) [Hemiselmis andersenii]|uniref:Uncharacterized protein n=1 Tax=Hemiselmis andersenii TaxID=464988 RepID=A9BLD8_HEMAN|nr:hypothetical protein HAN_3g521 [Hemiselmis andersenii]ABW98321.1 hypothetical protein HAN_3g521 [Hemiselmis andersenii]|mmetsp:Transcript_41733/g.101849  ORF Transcript_41733/g.101849 Transcript_41733/m.101849 type:complete len:145 (+) Transcript_41733:3404-3838(+)
MEKKKKFQIIVTSKERDNFIFQYEKIQNIKLLRIIFLEINFNSEKKIKIFFLTIPSEILLKIFEYSLYGEIFKNKMENSDKEKKNRKKLWEKEFFKINQTRLYGIILASSFLGEEKLFKISISLISKVLIRKSFLKLKNLRKPV